MRSFFDRVNGVLAVGLLAFALWAWTGLPDRIPTHFGLDGTADAWSVRTVWSWFGAPFIGLLLTAGLGWVRWILPRKPGWVNLPDRTRLADLPEVARRPVNEALSGFMALLQCQLLIIFSLIQFGTYRTAHGQSSQGVMIVVMILALLSSPFLLVVFFLRFQKALAEGKRLAEEEAAGRDGSET